MEPIDAKVLEFFPQEDIAWSDGQTGVYLSNNANGDPVVVTVPRETGEIKVETLEISGRPLSLAPNGSRLLIESGTLDRMELAVLDRETGQTETLLSYSGGSGPLSIAWTADGNKLALVHYEIPPEIASDPEKIAEMATKEALGNVPLKENQYLATNIIDIIDLGEDANRPMPRMAMAIYSRRSAGVRMVSCCWSKWSVRPNPQTGPIRPWWHWARLPDGPPTGSTMLIYT